VTHAGGRQPALDGTIYSKLSFFPIAQLLDIWRINNQLLSLNKNMLRTFHSNPSLGGFGSEEQETAAAATPDAFCQIVKELVDNAVDACMVLEDSECNNTATNTNKNKRKKQQTRVDTRKREKSKRVRVVIQKFSDNSSFQKAETRNIQDDDHVENHSTNHENDEILRVTVSDNGCGMSDIQACVGAFHTSKAHNATQPQQQELPSTTTTTSTTNNTHTAGRYGIGLTLVLLHAQRLVPNSCASIQSATCADSVWKVVAAAVDTESDAIRCLPRESIPKNSPSESGTSISILVPVCICLLSLWRFAKLHMNC
jgi:DNA topoisomerase VI subunit B